MGLDEDLAEYNRARKEGRSPTPSQQAAYDTVKNRPITQEDRIAEIYQIAQKEGWQGSRINQAISEIKFRSEGGTTEQWNAILKQEQNDRNTSKLQSAGLAAQGNAAIQANIEAERERLNNFTLASPNISTSSKVQDVSAKGTTATKAQDFGLGFTQDTKEYGFISSPDKPGAEKPTTTESQDRAKAQGAFNSLTPSVFDSLEKKPVDGRTRYSELEGMSTLNPIKGKQPDESLVSPYLRRYEPLGYSNGKAVQGPTKPNYAYEVTLNEGGKEESFNGVIGSLTYNYGKPKEGNYELSDITFENVARGFWEGGVLPLAQAVLAPKPIFTDIFGRSDAENKALEKTVNKIKTDVPAGKVASGYVLEQALTGQPITGTGEGLGYDIGSIGFDVATAFIPSKKVPIPLIIKDVEVPTIAGIKAVSKTLSVGFGDTVKVVAKTKFPKDIEIAPITAKENLRGVKLAADSSPQSQQVLATSEFVKNVSGISVKSIERSEVVEKIVAIGSKSKDPVRNEIGAKPFRDILEVETPSVKATFKDQQDKLFGRLGPIEGSLSQNPYVLPKFIREAGDFDFNVKNFNTAKARAIQTASDIDAAPGRIFEPKINEETKAAKIYLNEQNKSTKVGEFLNPQEIDESGIEQAIKGSTIFGKKIPKGTSTVEGLKVYSLQRQFVKKGESLYSLQRVGNIVELEPFGPRKEKDVSDFYAIAKTKEVNLRESGKIKEANELNLQLKKFRQLYSEVDIEGFFAKKQPGETTVFSVEKSLTEKLGSTASKVSRPASIGSASVAKSIAVSRPASRGTSRSNSLGSRSIGYSPPKNVSRPSTPTISRTISPPQSKPYNSPPKSKPYNSPPKSNILLDSKPYGNSSGSKSPGSNSLGSKSLGSLGSRGSRNSFGSLDGNITEPQSSTKKAIAIIPIWKTKTDLQKPEKPKPKFDWIGNVSETDISGIYNRSETTYGKKKINKFTSLDFSRAKKDYNSRKLKTNKKKSVLGF